MSERHPWKRDPRFGRFVELFNARRYFEAHEALEGLWLEVKGAERGFLQGLIQLAVALEHAARNNRSGAGKVLASASRRLASHGERHAGIAIGSLQRRIASFLDGRAPEPPRWPAPTRSRGVNDAKPAARSMMRSPKKPGKKALSSAVPRRPAHGRSAPMSVARSGRVKLDPVASRRDRARTILDGLRRLYPEAGCEMQHSSALELLVATILSAQCTDARVNMTTPALFARYPDARAYAAADLGEVGAIIKSTGFFRNKAKSIVALGRALVEKHGGEVPESMDDLVQLPGVGRKTANVVLSEWFKRPGIAVDTHVIRLTGPVWRLTDETDPVKIEFVLHELLEEADWSFFGIATIWHGRRICSARAPNCEGCLLSQVCPTSFSWARGGGGKVRRPVAPEPAM